MEQLLTPLSFLTPTIQLQSLSNIGGFPATGGEIAGDVVITGSLTVLGSTVSVDTTTINVENNVLTLNSGQTGSPTLNASILTHRGSALAGSMTWNESQTRWTAGLYGTELPVVTKYAVTLPAGGATATVTHNLNTLDVFAKAYTISTGLAATATITIVDANNVSFTFGGSIPASTYRVVIVG